MDRDFSTSSLELADIVDYSDPMCVFKEVSHILLLFNPSLDQTRLAEIFDDTVKLYRGAYPGYKACSTRYHDLGHTLETFLSMARLIHGYNVSEKPLSDKAILLGLISSLMHDAGYIQHSDDLSGTGAKFTLTHIARSIEFAERYLTLKDYCAEDIAFCRSCLLCTNINTDPFTIPFASDEERITSMMLGTADILSQIADRAYLEKLSALYSEFREGNVTCFLDEFDLYEKTVGFFSIVEKRLKEQLGGMNRYFIVHFQSRFTINEDLYRKAVDKNARYLAHLIQQSDKNISPFLRRCGSALNGDTAFGV